jgi:hypothetical protein
LYSSKAEILINLVWSKLISGRFGGRTFLSIKYLSVLIWKNLSRFIRVLKVLKTLKKMVQSFS